MLNGEWFGLNKLLAYTIGKPAAVADVFEALDNKGKADILSGRVKQAVAAKPVNKTKQCMGQTGSGGKQCDGCSQSLIGWGN